MATAAESSETPKSQSDGTMRVVATAYCQRGTTKSGVDAQPGIVAADPRFLPLGTVLRIIGPPRQYGGIYTVMDTGSAVKGRTVDIFMPSCAGAVHFGRRTMRVRVIKKGP
jgi:3D (Asp-Asp-Asp) domain-containing protein